MNFGRIARQTTTVAVAAALLLSGSAQTFAKSKDSTGYKETYDFSHMTRSDMLKLPEQQKNADFQVP